MLEKTKEDLVKVIKLIRDRGPRGIRREEVPEALQKAVTVAIQHGYVRRESRVWKKHFGRKLTSIWLVAQTFKSNPENPLAKPEPVDTEAKLAREQQARRENDFRMMKTKLWSHANKLPAVKTIKERILALKFGDVEALEALWLKIWEYYGLGNDINATVYEITPANLEKVKKKRESNGSFLLARGDFRKEVKELVTKGIIQASTLEYIQNKISAIPLGDVKALEQLQAKIREYYKLNDL